MKITLKVRTISEQIDYFREKWPEFSPEQKKFILFFWREIKGIDLLEEMQKVNK